MQSNKRLRKLLLQTTQMPLRKLSPTVRAYPPNLNLQAHWQARLIRVMFVNDGVHAAVDAQTLGGAITQAGGVVDNDLSLTFDNDFGRPNCHSYLPSQTPSSSGFARLRIRTFV